jgi:hypothetical protein
MQHTANSNNKNGGNSQVQSVVIIAITLFALAGAILGFSVGALTRHPASNTQTANNSKPNPSSNTNVQPTQAATTPTPVPSPTATAQTLGPPLVGGGPTLTGTYTYTVQAVDTANNAIKSNGVTCRLWITKSNPKNLSPSGFKVIANLTSPVPNEIVGGLTFDSSTPQTQPCVNGLGTWNVNISPALSKGNYYIVGLTDWNGTYFNWSWITQSIQ